MKHTSCLYNFTANMCGNPEGCRGCRCNLDERLVKPTQSQPAAKEVSS
jgi:hypothetical protein